MKRIRSVAARYSYNTSKRYNLFRPEVRGGEDWAEIVRDNILQSTSIRVQLVLLRR